MKNLLKGIGLVFSGTFKNYNGLEDRLGRRKIYHDQFEELTQT